VAERPDWDAYFLAGAQWAATRADCTRRKVGAILVNARHEVRGVGYNGAPAGVPGCLAGNCPRGKLSPEQCAPNSDYSNCISDHAERNAIRHADPAELAGSTLYVTDEPCPACATLIRAAGIKRVVTPQRANSHTDVLGKDLGKPTA
jgi:dCMP deaminase